MKLVIDLPDDVVKWFKGKGFIPIGQYLTVDEAMKKAEPLSEVLDEIKKETFENAIKGVNGEGFIFLGRLVKIFNKHIERGTNEQ